MVSRLNNWEPAAPWLDADQRLARGRALPFERSRRGETEQFCRALDIDGRFRQTQPDDFPSRLDARPGRSLHHDAAEIAPRDQVLERNPAQSRALKQAGVEYDRVGVSAKHYGRAEQVLDLLRTCGAVSFDFNAGRRPVGAKIAAHGLDHWVDDVLGMVSATEADRLERAKSPAGKPSGNFEVELATGGMIAHRTDRAPSGKGPIPVALVKDADVTKVPLLA